MVLDALLPHYERELAFIRTRAADFARAYPKIAGRLQLTGDVGDDPHVERLIESFALLTSRVHKRLDDDFPLFTESLIETLYPHYLRPFPSCSIALFDVGSNGALMTKGVKVSRGTPLMTRPVKGVTCKFTTTSNTTLLPLSVAAVSYRNAGTLLTDVFNGERATSVLSITLEKLSTTCSWQTIFAEPLTLYLNGESSQVGVMREALTRQSLGFVCEVDGGSDPARPLPVRVGSGSIPTLRGFAEDEALLEWDARVSPAYRLLMEYFAFPDKFNFVEFPVPSGIDQLVDEAGPNRLTLKVAIKGVSADSDESRLLESIGEHNLVLGAVPVINKFRQAADPIRVDQRSASYPVVVDGRKAYGYELYSLDRVFRVRQSAAGEVVDELRPFFSINHDDLLGDQFQDEDDLESSARSIGATRKGGLGRVIGYWQLQMDEELAKISPGYENSIVFVDDRFDPTVPSIDTLSMDVSATNRDLPSMLSHGTVGGDLFQEGGGTAKEISFLRKPTTTYRFERGRGALWRLISHLSLNHLSLSGGGIDALKEMLRLYDLPRSPTNRRQIDGLVAVDFKPATAWLPGEPYATFVRGTEIRLAVDEGSFVGIGLGLLATVLDHFFSLYVHANSFTKLTIVSARTQEELMSCPPRNGDMPLV